MDGQMVRWTDRQTGRYIDEHTDRKTDGQE